MKALRFHGVTFVAMLLLLTACQEPSISRSEGGLLFLGSDEATDVVERVIAPGNRALILDGFGGTVLLTGTDSDVARFEITRRARGDSPAEARAQLQNLNIEEVGDETSYRYQFTASETALSRFDVVGTVPAGTRIRIRWVAGNVTLDGLSGDADVQSQHGNLSYSGAGSIVHLRTRNGSVDAKLAAVSDGSDVDLLTANGDIVAVLPVGASAHVEAGTSAGSISTDQMAFVSETLSPMDAGARFQARLGQGTGRVVLATQHGSIRISSYVPEVIEREAAADTARAEASTDLAPDSVIAVPDPVIAVPDSVPGTDATADSLK
jgi:hypothetical protein